MSLKYVIKKSVAKIGPKAGQTIYYAQPAAQDSVTFHSLCKRIAEESSLTSADVKGILDRLVNILTEELPNGKTVRIGELGSFRLSFGSKQLDDPKSFSVDQIQKHRLVFIPSAELKSIPARGKLRPGSSALAFDYERVEPQPKKKPGAGDNQTPSPSGPDSGGDQGSTGGGL
ncbi:HU family DNA-binding protein [Porphyromonas gulae]|uniref:HU family DNA-binding protein n=1 Tax=Porphyromonas gulae TaxID=111105 RepID=UPI00051DC2DB|nr:HU family DNA-binding protein [Porphyromonas gulae]KGL48775.1 histidinol phosphate phosphatase [Porphyromonas gulae]